MANDFRFSVVALDRFTSVFGKLRRQAKESTQPLRNVERINRQIFQTPQLKEAGRGFGVIAGHAREIASQLSGISGPAASLFGLGGVTSLIGVAGAVAALTNRWAALGFQVTRAAQGFGVSTEMLQRYRGAAALAGVSTDGMTSAIGSLAQTLQDAQFGRNPTALFMLGKLGIDIKRGKDGIVDTQAALEDLSRAISRISDPQVQRIVASAFGLEEALPLLRQGPEAIRKLGDEAQRLGLVQGKDALEWSVKFTESLNRMKGAMEGVFNQAGQANAGWMTRGMDFVTDSTKRKFSANPFDWMTYALEAGQALADTTPKKSPWSQKASGKVTEDRPLPGPKPGWGGPEQAARDAAGLAIVRRELANATDPRDREALMREIARRTGEPVKVDITLSGAPPGTTAQARSAGQAVPVRISHAMPAGNLP